MGEDDAAFDVEHFARCQDHRQPPHPVARAAVLERGGARRVGGDRSAHKGSVVSGCGRVVAAFSGEPPTETEKGRAADVLRQAAEIAQAATVKLCIEYLNRFECYFLTTAADAVALVKRVDHPNFRTMYDTFHAHIEEKNQAAAIRQVAPVLGHVHISENDRGTPGTGQVAWDTAFKALREIRYDGWTVIEAFGRALPALAAATKVWRDLFPNAEQVYTNGLAFIKKKWAEAA